MKRSNNSEGMLAATKRAIDSRENGQQARERMRGRLALLKERAAESVNPIAFHEGVIAASGALYGICWSVLKLKKTNLPPRTKESIPLVGDRALVIMAIIIEFALEQQAALRPKLEASVDDFPKELDISWPIRRTTPRRNRITEAQGRLPFEDPDNEQPNAPLV